MFEYIGKLGKIMQSFTKIVISWPKKSQGYGDIGVDLTEPGHTRPSSSLDLEAELDQTTEITSNSVVAQVA